MGDLNVQEVEAALILPVKVVPGSSKTAIAGLINGMLKVKVSAPTRKGKANKCLINFLAKKLKLKRQDVSIISDRTAAVKKLRVVGLSPDQLRALILPSVS